jgi:beta-galactosidase
MEFSSVKRLVVLSARYMPRNIQQKLSAYAAGGGTLLIYGELPEYDLEGNPCTVLLDAMNLPSPVYIKNSPPTYFLTLSCCGNFADVTEAQRGSAAQCFPKDEDAMLMPVGSTLMCGMVKQVTQGKIYAITCDYPADYKFYKHLFAEMSLYPSLKASHYRQGIYISRTESQDSQQLIYLINLDAFTKTVDIEMDGEVLFKDFVLYEKASYILPVNVKAGSATIVKSTAEITVISKESLTFRLTQPRDVIILKTEKVIVSHPCYEVSKLNGLNVIVSKKHFLSDNYLTIRLA